MYDNASVLALSSKQKAYNGYYAGSTPVTRANQNYLTKILHYNG